MSKRQAKWQEKRAKVAPTIATDQPFASSEVAVPLHDSVAIRRTSWYVCLGRYTARHYTSVATWLERPGYCCKSKKRSWLRLRDDGAIVCSFLRIKKATLRNNMKKHIDSRAHQSAVSMLDKRKKEAWKTCADKVIQKGAILLLPGAYPRQDVAAQKSLRN